VDTNNRVWILTEGERKVIVSNPEPAGVVNTADNTKRKLRFRQENDHVSNLRKDLPTFSLWKKFWRKEVFIQSTRRATAEFGSAVSEKGLVEFDGREFRLYTKENGLSDNTVRLVTEDNFGNLWIGSDWGAMKFNRSNFITYHVEDGLDNEQISSICKTEWRFARFDGELGAQPL
jgi:ligand-binding sensor domain-containing protein